jgi:CubicO group peptidase (beta-lactamase class C family)
MPRSDAHAPLMPAMLSRRATGYVLLGGTMTVMTPPALEAAISPHARDLDNAYPDGLSRSTPARAGVSSRAVLEFLQDVQAAGLSLNSYMLYRGGHVVAEGWWWPYRPDLIHMMHSLTKSVTACAVGWALAEGRFSLTDKVVSFFQDELPPDVSGNLADMSVEDLLTMRTGHDHQTSGSVWRPVRSSWVAEFFKIPVVYKPGTKFVYTSAATYMLSAIISKTTGRSAYEYLKPRLFEPLNIRGAEWYPGPQDITPGANGLSWHTADSLKLGILHLQDGMWDGVQLLPKGWAKIVHQPHVPGRYGYQWWLGPGGAYFADGMFGQYAFVFPNEGAVLAVTASIQDEEAFYPIVWKHFPSAFQGGPAEGNAKTDTALAAVNSRLRFLEPLKAKNSAMASRISGKTFVCNQNDDKIANIRFDFSADLCTFVMQDHRGEHIIKCGLKGYVESFTTMTGDRLHHEYQPDTMRVVAGASWTSPDTLVMTWLFVESAFLDTVVCRFGGTGVTFDRRVNVNSGARTRPTITGSLA